MAIKRQSDAIAIAIAAKRLADLIIESARQAAPESLGAGPADWLELVPEADLIIVRSLERIAREMEEGK